MAQEVTIKRSTRNTVRMLALFVIMICVLYISNKIFETDGSKQLAK